LGVVGRCDPPRLPCAHMLNSRVSGLCPTPGWRAGAAASTFVALTDQCEQPCVSTVCTLCEGIGPEPPMGGVPRIGLLATEVVGSEDSGAEHRRVRGMRAGRGPTGPSDVEESSSCATGLSARWAGRWRPMRASQVGRQSRSVRGLDGDRARVLLPSIAEECEMIEVSQASHGALLVDDRVLLCPHDVRSCESEPRASYGRLRPEPTSHPPIEEREGAQLADSRPSSCCIGADTCSCTSDPHAFPVNSRAALALVEKRCTRRHSPAEERGAFR